MTCVLPFWREVDLPLPGEPPRTDGAPRRPRHQFKQAQKDVLTSVDSSARPERPQQGEHHDDPGNMTDQRFGSEGGDDSPQSSAEGGQGPEACHCVSIIGRRQLHHGDRVSHVIQTVLVILVEPPSDLVTPLLRTDICEISQLGRPGIGHSRALQAPCRRWPCTAAARSDSSYAGRRGNRSRHVQRQSVIGGWSITGAFRQN